MEGRREGGERVDVRRQEDGRGRKEGGREVEGRRKLSVSYIRSYYHPHSTSNDKLENKTRQLPGLQTRLGLTHVALGLGDHTPSH